VHALARFVTGGAAEPASLAHRQERARARGAALDQQRERRQARHSHPEE
jgi:hypothetical protein